MSDFLTYAAADSGGLFHPEQPHAQVSAATPTLLDIDGTQNSTPGEMLFEQLLLATGSAPLLPDDETLLTEDESTFEALLTDMPDEQVEQLAQQFLATLVNRDVPMLMTATELTTAPDMPAMRAQNLPLQTEKTAGAAAELPPVNLAAVAENRPVRPAVVETVDVVIPKTTLTTAGAENLRLAALHAAPGANAPVISAGQPHAQVNAPMRADATGQALSTQLQHALGERLNLQINNQIQHATIRLDPPDMGRIEIAVQIEAGKIHVQINAGQSDVYRALQQVSNELRQALTEQHFVEVDVRLSNREPQQQPGQRQQQSGRESDLILANEQPDTAGVTRTRDDKSILMTV
ncbi:flagellar hook-length control protein FliK [Buttiauxella sp.]|uniref:flagellar hook-length control protein FliK n=1 Tax=Buttiauxella sp. TaxID=1972222 RepID=UPI003C74EFF6